MVVKLNKRVKIIRAIIIILCLIIMADCSELKAGSKTSGTDENGNVWNYDIITKTLTFTGTKDIQENYSMDGHGPEPAWHTWREKTEHLNIEDGITGIGGGAFHGFSKLKTLVIADTVTHIDTMAFESCVNLRSIHLSQNLLNIKTGAFSTCGMQQIQLPEKIKTIGDFSGCVNLKEIRLPGNVTKMESFMFADCIRLEKVVLPAKLTEIKESDFRNCKKLTFLEIPPSVRSVTMSAFSGSGVKNIVLPPNVQRIKKGKPIGGKVFSGGGDLVSANKKLRSIVIQSKKIKKISKGAFSGLSKSCVVKVPKSRKAQYKKMLWKSGLNKKIKVTTI